MYSIIDVEPEELTELLKEKEIKMSDVLAVKFTDGVRVLTCDVVSVRKNRSDGFSLRMKPRSMGFER